MLTADVYYVETPLLYRKRKRKKKEAPSIIQNYEIIYDGVQVGYIMCMYVVNLNKFIYVSYSVLGCSNKFYQPRDHIL